MWSFLLVSSGRGLAWPSRTSTIVEEAGGVCRGGLLLTHPQVERP